MEQLLEKGLVKSIGVANFTTMMMTDLLAYAHIKPVMNQIELHPYNAQTELVDFCIHQNVAVTAYSPLGSPGGAKENDPIILKDPVIKKIANTHKKSTAQVLIRWALQRGTIPIPKSTTQERITENAAVFDFELSPAEMEHIAALNINHRFVDPIKWWGVPYFS
jgi:diketogulonate reductase-like aldo/keto reductase